MESKPPFSVFIQAPQATAFEPSISVLASLPETMAMQLDAFVECLTQGKPLRGPLASALGVDQWQVKVTDDANVLRTFFMRVGSPERDVPERTFVDYARQGRFNFFNEGAYPQLFESRSFQGESAYFWTEKMEEMEPILEEVKSAMRNGQPTPDYTAGHYGHARIHAQRGEQELVCEGRWV